MKLKELALMSEADLENKETELKKELMKINSQIAIGAAPKNVSRVREIKKTIARMLTVKQVKQKKGGIKKE